MYSTVFLCATSEVLKTLDAYILSNVSYAPPPGNLQPYGHIESGASPVVRVGLPVPAVALAGKATEREARTTVGGVLRGKYRSRKSHNISPRRTVTPDVGVEVATIKIIASTNKAERTYL